MGSSYGIILWGHMSIIYNPNTETWP